MCLRRTQTPAVAVIEKALPESERRRIPLNLSNLRYTAEEFLELLSRRGVLCVAMDCSDRFGAHGVVGFARVDEEQDKPVLKDLVLSCRVVQKKVEHTFLGRYAGREAARGKNVLLTELIRTDRNEPIRQVFEDLRFRTLTEEGAFSLMEWPLDPERELRDLMEVEADLPGREKAADLNDRVQT